MRRRLSIALLGVFGGCVSISALAPPAEPGWTTTADLTELQRGRRLYITRCASCHAVEPVDAYSIAHWRKLLPRMYEESKMNAADAAAIEAYVFAAHQAMTNP